MKTSALPVKFCRVSRCVFIRVDTVLTWPVENRSWSIIGTVKDRTKNSSNLLLSESWISGECLEFNRLEFIYVYTLCKNTTTQTIRNSVLRRKTLKTLKNRLQFVCLSDSYFVRVRIPSFFAFITSAHQLYYIKLQIDN